MEKTSFKLRMLGNALLRELTTFEDLKNGEIDYSDELKKAVQNAIKELCTAVCNSVDS